MSTKELQAELARLVDKFEEALQEAEAFALEHKLGFNISPEYGMGGYFNGGEETYCEEGWNPSSLSC